MRLPVDLGGMTLRGLRSGDEADLLEYRSLAEVARHQYWEPDAPESIKELVAQQSELWAGVAGVPLVLAAEVEGKVVGNCTLVIADPVSRQGELGFSWHPVYAGRGLATRAVAGA